ncbi:MAG: biotin synthase BioB [Candidatus Latescibacterota bacterium]
MPDIIAHLSEPGSPENLSTHIRSLLIIPRDEFREQVIPAAGEITRREFGNGVFVCGLLAFSSICVNDCTYCGLRISNTVVPRMRIPVEDIKRAIERFRETGLDRVFLVSGEDRTYSVEDIAGVTAYAKSLGFHVTLGLGEYPVEALRAFREAGCDCYTLKFETSSREIFRRVKPTSDYDSRMACIHSVKPLGMELGSGNIVGLEGQTLDDLVEDILLMRKLGIDWAPVVPYLPAPGTPMAETTPMGNVALLLREVAILRILLPRTIITAGQPKQGSQLGFADPEGNRDALEAGANILFVDITPHAMRRDFQITPGRILPGVSHVDKLLEGMGLERKKSTV